MKKLIKILLLIFISNLVFISCRGPEGPVGPEGVPGPEILPLSFEFEVSLLQSNNFEDFAGIPSQVDVFPSDMLLVYALEDFIDQENLDVWRQLPITEFNNDGTLVFNFDFTEVDIRIFLEANYNLGPADEFNNFLMRAVHIPADFLQNSKAKGIETAGSLGELEQILGVEIKKLN